MRDTQIRLQARESTLLALLALLEIVTQRGIDPKDLCKLMSESDGLPASGVTCFQRSGTRFGDHRRWSVVETIEWLRAQR